jgi:hypothetical protein
MSPTVVMSVREYEISRGIPLKSTLRMLEVGVATDDRRDDPGVAHIDWNNELLCSRQRLRVDMMRDRLQWVGVGKE